MQNKFTKVTLVCVLIASTFLTGCSTAWVSTLDSILAAAAPALINILEIVAVAKGQAMNSGLQAKITADAASIKTLAGDFATASAAAAPGVCSQLSAAIGTYSQDEQSVLAIAQVSDPATQTKIQLLSSLVAGTVQAIIAVIPSCNSASSVKGFRASPPLSLSSFVSDYNDILVVPTGNKAVDSLTKKRKIHAHPRWLRYATAGRLN